MPDLAELNLRIDSSHVTRASRSLLTFQNRAERVNKVVQGLNRTLQTFQNRFATMTPTMRNFVTAVSRAERELQRTSRTSSQTGRNARDAGDRFRRFARDADQARQSLQRFNTVARQTPRNVGPGGAGGGGSRRLSRAESALSQFGRFGIYSLGSGNVFTGLGSAAAFGLGSLGGPGGLAVAGGIALGVEALAEALRLLATAAATAGTAIVGLGVASLTTFAQFERAENILTLLTGSAEQASATFEELRRFAAVTPLQLPDLLVAQRRLQAYGFEAKEATRITKSLANVASTSISPGSDLAALALAIGQIRQRGRLQGQERKQLSERGVGVEKGLAALLGVSEAEAVRLSEAGRVSGELGVQAALKNVEDRFGGFAAGLAKDLQGRFHTLVDELKKLLAEIGGALEDVLGVKQFVTDLTEATRGLSSGIGGAIRLLADMGTEADKLNPVAKALERQFRAVAGVLEDLGDLAGTVFDVLTLGTVQGFQAYVSTTFGPLLDMLGKLVGETDSVEELAAATDELVRAVREAGAAAQGEGLGTEPAPAGPDPRSLLLPDEKALARIDSLIEKVHSQREAITQTTKVQKALGLQQEFDAAIMEAYGTRTGEAAEKIKKFKFELTNLFKAISQEYRQSQVDDAVDSLLSAADRFGGQSADLTFSTAFLRRQALDQARDQGLLAAAGDPERVRAVAEAYKLATASLDDLLDSERYSEWEARVKAQYEEQDRLVLSLDRQIVELQNSQLAAGDYADRMQAAALATRIFGEDSVRASEATEMFAERLTRARRLQDQIRGTGQLQDAFGGLDTQNRLRGLTPEGRARATAALEVQRAAELAFPDSPAAVQSTVDTFRRAFDEAARLDALHNFFGTVESGLQNAVVDGLEAAIYEEDWKAALSAAFRSSATDALRFGVGQLFGAVAGSDGSGNQQTTTQAIIGAVVKAVGAGAGSGGGGGEGGGTGGTSASKMASKSASEGVVIITVQDQQTADAALKRASSAGATALVAKGSGAPGIAAGKVRPGRRGR